MFTWVLALGLLVSTVFANEDGAYLDPKYKKHVHPRHVFQIYGEKSEKFPVRSDVEWLISFQSPVKSQEDRGTCSIFSSTALLESLLQIKKGFSEKTDLSEEYLHYLVSRFKEKDDGSDSETNLRSFFNYGSTFEQLMPYIGEEWENLKSSPLARKRCGHLQGKYRNSCLIGHWDPYLLTMSDRELLEVSTEFYDARKKAFQLRDAFIHPSKDSFVIERVDRIKRLLYQGTPVVVDVDFYYGAWNHAEAEDLGIERDKDQWAEGFVGYPLKGSVDAINTQKSPAAHSVVIVGYDDSVEVTLEHLMPDGEYKTVTHRGVYYFKNSWGTRSFGRLFEINGNRYPGYGMMLQDYVHEFGTFYQMPLE